MWLRFFKNTRRWLLLKYMPEVIMMQATKWLEKWEMERDEQPLIPEHLDSSKLKSLHDLSVGIEAKVPQEVVDYVGLWVNGGAQLHILFQRVLDPSDPL
jgi:hypothetical protein